MHRVDMNEAKNKLSALVEEVLAGDEVLITRAGKPVVRLIPFQSRKKLRKPGRWKGKLWVADDFDATPEVVVASFGLSAFHDQG
jgi:prevent-host-death family protein